MSPLGVGNSRTNTLKTGEAKLWILLVGVNQYQDARLPSLRYPAVDCKGLGDALAKATQGFPKKEVVIHHDFAQEVPTTEIVRASLQRIVSQTQNQDTILLYFSGHGMLEPETQQPILCLADTQKNDLVNTGIPMQELLQMLSTSSAHQQLVCLDTCHSGDMMLWGTSNATPRDANIPTNYLNPTPQLLQVLRQRAAQSKGFCALLSCDQGQQSWEFPELGHGVFTYYLMRGLLGEAADSQGVIEADGLYKYVYRQTLQYIDKLNQQLRLINQQKRNRGDSKIHPEYPLQTPKRIVEGVGELILGFKTDAETFHLPRRALVIDGFASDSKISSDLSRVLRGGGGFELEYFDHNSQNWSQLRSTIQTCLQWEVPKTKTFTHVRVSKNTPTTLLYLRGQIEEIEDGEAWLILASGVRLSRSCLRQELRRASAAQQIIILDCPGATTLDNWIEDLHLGGEQAQCLIAAASTLEEPELFSQVLFTTLAESDPQAGLSIAGWISHLQTNLEAKGIQLNISLSNPQGVIDILPGGIDAIFADETIIEVTQIEPAPSPLSKVVGISETFKTTQSEPTSPLHRSKAVDIPETIVKTTQSEPKPYSTPEKTSSNNKSQPPFPVLESLDVEAFQPFLTIGSPQQLRLEQLLIRLMGPIAPTLFKKALSKNYHPKKLLEQLAMHLLPEQQVEFEVQVMRIIQTVVNQPATPIKTQPQPPQPTQPKAVDATFIGQCERHLIDLIGPIGTFIIREVFKKYPRISSSDFVQKLAAEIPNERISIEFQRRLEKEAHRVTR